ncbi:MAG: MATE family efflux transporter [Selenomonadaceae bacterium]|nr:MATE family efflux transporter [Selenomonadaceae bacterium]
MADEGIFKVNFSDKALRAMIVPLFLEQFLLLMVGMADTLVISYVSEAAVSGVTLVEQFNVVMIYLFTALAAGGAVVISQYIGHGEREKAGETASQLLTFAILLSCFLSLAVLLWRRELLTFLFGSVEPLVMESCVTYLGITALSYPALAVYNAGAALYRSMGRTKTTMYISIGSNFVNIAGNIIGVFVLQAGVAGVAYPSLLARTLSALVITWLCFSKTNEVRYRLDWILAWNHDLLRRILSIAVPNGVESGIFQLVKVALSSIVALFGTYQIAANGVAQSIWTVTSMCTTVMGIVFITIIGQCMGAQDIRAAEFYFKKLMGITVKMSVVWNVLTFALTPLFLNLYALEPETKTLVIYLVLLHNTFSAFVFPYAGALGNGLRATGDVRYTMVVAIASTGAGSSWPTSSVSSWREALWA